MTEIQPASRELVTLAGVMRPDWDEQALSDALIAAKQAGWSWLRTFNFTVRLMADEEAVPADLRRAAANPAERKPGTPPTPVWREARTAISARLAEHEDGAA